MTQTIVTRKRDIKSNWHLVDLKDQILGRVATMIAQKLMGKHKPNLSPNLDIGDYVVAINASYIKLTGKKPDQKQYFRHSGYPGGAKVRTLAEQIRLDPTQVIKLAVAGMLPKNKLRPPRLNRLKVFAGGEHQYHDKFTS